MSFSSSEKPSSRFRVLLRREPEKETDAKSTRLEGVCDNISHGIRENCMVMSRTGEFSVSDDTERNIVEKPQRYGGAIVRVSELRKAGGLLPFSATGSEGPSVGDNSKERNFTASSYLRFGGSITNCNNKELDSRALCTFAVAGTGEKVLDGRKATRRNSPTRRKGSGKVKNKNNTRNNNSISYAKSRGTKVRRGGKKSNILELQSNGEPYGYRWSTKNGRRQLHYGSRTYTGKTAHQIWDKIKVALKSKEASSLPSQSSSHAIVIPTAPQLSSLIEPGKKIKDVKRSRVETTRVANTATKRSCIDSHKTSQTTLLTGTTSLLSSTVRPKLLLDDDEPLYKRVCEGDVVLVSDSDNSEICSSTSSTLSSWPSLRAGSSELTINDGDLSSQGSLSETEENVYKGCHDNKRNRIVELDNQKGNCSPSKESSTVFEHDGWLYPTELLPLLCKENSTGSSLPLGNAKLGQQNIEKENNRNNVQGITFLCNKGTDTVSSLQPSSVEVLPSVKNPAYSQRYEEMNALLDLPIDDIGDFFVTGEEIGGMRFAS
ncbi:uncharacterized protein TM35_000113220 [Trypanosoma theileri]|uniref:Uncharacterized protein n=1 Tax=Trypanosoma theileri TaxID=67003 RepID=A0A1X0NZ12_9TRYP|nr:uncharacterized protein TM35_000113220 [Trypanosoma theileri]ORC89788.1 hypothetical protein TM35_000113220 [Trypanosoma theileri]